MKNGAIDAFIKAATELESDLEKTRSNPGKKDASKPSVGVNFNDSKQEFTDQILAGEKTIETRATNSLAPYVGKRVGIVRTGKGKAMLVGYATIGSPVFYKNRKEFDADFKKHRVGPESPYYIGPSGKYGYPLTRVEKTEPVPVNKHGIIARSITDLDG